MKLDLTIKKNADTGSVDIVIKNKSNKDNAITAWKINMFGIEDLELQLTNIVAQLYAYRKEYKPTQEECQHENNGTWITKGPLGSAESKHECIKCGEFYK